jgi:hypothetical protein
MSKQYRWCEASGPVPYPDDSHRMLDSYDVLVSGDGWADLAALGFVEEVTGKPGKKAAPKLPPAPEPLPEPAAEEKPAGAGANKTVGEMVAKAAETATPIDVAGEAEKVASRKKSKGKKKK